MICLLQIDETLSEPIAAGLYYKPARGSTQQLSAVHDVVERCYREHGIVHAKTIRWKLALDLINSSHARL